MHSTSVRSATALGAAAALLALSGCSSGSSSTGEAGGSGASGGSGTMTAGTLTVGSDLTYPPYAYLDGKTPAGFDPDISRALAGASGLKTTFVDTRFEQLIAGLGTGHFDVIASDLYITDERKKQVDFIPYFTTGNSIVVQTSGGDRPAVVTDLCGKSVAVIKGGQIVQKLRDEASKQCTDEGEKAVDVREFGTDPEGTQALLSGQVDAQVTDGAVAKAAADKTNGRLTISSKSLIYPVQSGLAVKRGNTALKKTLTTALDELTKNGTYTELLKKYNLGRAEGS
ncbi:ABC transporter substrate-binding protein [Streptomyces sp. NBC_00878]|uniref:ABC transporter substrate-binding protein n=1 Tax=Streptomyces sp. NBC_00878 TaxID=2975854 RepID=UPI00224CFED7|nr:ABC transporter substrate-binding protein [Streptomyces sp. NBC_00878]MCX4907449.1 ABC transporter substrate-binding protein [Streptomyces sp. NBC_00878]